MTSYVRAGDGTWQKPIVITEGVLGFSSIGVTTACGKIYFNRSLE